MNDKLTTLLFCCFLSMPLQAIEMRGIDQDTTKNNLSITPKFDIQLSQKVISAIDNGIVITFVYQAKSFQRINWWFDAVIESKSNTFEVRYFSLSSQYQLHHTNRKNKLSFVTLEQLLTHLGQQTTFEFNLKKPADYLETRIFLDKQALPSIMQLPNVFDADWNINSDWQTAQLSAGNRAE